MVNFSSIIPSIPFPNNLPLEIVLKTISSFFKFFEAWFLSSAISEKDMLIIEKAIDKSFQKIQEQK